MCISDHLRYGIAPPYLQPAICTLGTAGIRLAIQPDPSQPTLPTPPGGTAGGRQGWMATAGEGKPTPLRIGAGWLDGITPLERGGWVCGSKGPSYKKAFSLTYI